LKKGKTNRITFKITNAGKVDGAEVAQLYIKDVKASEDRPEKELKNFEKVFLKCGETKTVSMEITKQQLAFFSKLKNKWITEAGTFEVLIGSSSRDIRLKQMIQL
jgi:beta-glucosidase